MLQAIELIARREGIGDMMAEGTLRMAEKIGNGSMDFAMQAKGLEAGMHEPRLRPQLAFGWIVGPTGADHMFAVMDMNTEMGIDGLKPLGILQTVPSNDLGPRRIAILKASYSRVMFTDSLCVCMMPGVNANMVVPAVTGWEMSPAEQVLAGERILTTQRLFNIKQGFTAADDKIPERYYQGKTDGALVDKPVDREKMEKARLYYYASMGWDANGVPTQQKIEELYIE
jgi:aldehyde:ferredoxin oxidoreductase